MINDFKKIISFIYIFSIVLSMLKSDNTVASKNKIKQDVLVENKSLDLNFFGNINLEKTNNKNKSNYSKLGLITIFCGLVYEITMSFLVDEHFSFWNRSFLGEYRQSNTACKKIENIFYYFNIPAVFLKSSYFKLTNSNELSKIFSQEILNKRECQNKRYGIKLIRKTVFLR